MQFTGLADIAFRKLGLGKSFEMSIARVQEASSGVETFSLSTQVPGNTSFKVSSKLVRLSELFCYTRLLKTEYHANERNS